MGATTAVVLGLVLAVGSEHTETGGPVRIPNFKWGQNVHELTLTLESSCASASLTTKFNVDHVSVSCDSAASDGRLELEFSPRSDIDPAHCACTPRRAARSKGDTVVCKLRKRLPHMFDRLTYGPLGQLAPHASADWDLMDERVADDADAALGTQAYDTDSAVVTLDRAGLAAAIDSAANAAVVVDVSLPWCPHCNARRLDFEKAAEKLQKLKGDMRVPVLLAHLDMREERELARAWAVDCNLACSFTVFRKDEGGLHSGGFQIHAPNKVPNFVAALKTLSKPLVEVTPPANAEARLSGEGFVRLGKGKVKKAASAVAFAVLGERHATLAKIVGNVAASLRASITADVPPPKLKFHSVAADSLMGQFAPAFVVRRPDGSASWLTGNELSARAKLKYGDDGFASMEAALQVWCTAAALPLIESYEWSHREIYDRAQLAPLLIFIDKTIQKSRQVPSFYYDLAQRYTGKVGFLTLDKAHFGYMTMSLGIPDDTSFPCIGLTTNFSAADPDVTPDRYAFRGDPLSQDDVIEYLDAFLGGSLPKYRKTQALPAGYTFTKGAVRILTGDEVHAGALGISMDTETDDFIVALTKSYAANSRKLEAVADRLAALFAKVDLVTVASLDVEDNELEDGAIADGFDPTGAEDSVLILIPGSGPQVSMPLTYTGKLTEKKLLSWLKKRSPALTAGWAAVKEAQKQRKKDKKDKKAAEAARREEIAAILPVDVSGDGKLLKQTYIEAPEGAVTPVDGHLVSAHYTGTFADTGKKFDSSRGKAPFDFTVGQGAVIKCWEQGFKAMKVGESAVLTCHHDLAYGNDGSPPEIPAESTLKFDVELISSSPRKDEL